MSKNTKIQWCDDTVNPVAGCDGCELFETRSQATNRLAKALPGDDQTENRKVVGKIAERFGDETPLKARNHVVDAMRADGLIDDAKAKELKEDNQKSCKCYAAILCEMRYGKEGWPDRFDEPRKFPKRMAEAAGYRELIGEVREGKPWLNGQPRLIFISDMGDAFSNGIDFDYLRDKVITAITSEKGARHVWLWLTKRPKRMAEFGQWLSDQGIAWPDNLVAMTTVTSADTIYRVNDLREVPAKMRGLSVEPLWGEVKLDLTSIDWVIVGGESGKTSESFQVEWALNLRDQCQETGVKFFIKQLGEKPSWKGVPIELADEHGGEWDEWPDATWNIREVPDFGSLVAKPLAPVELVEGLDEDDKSYLAERELVVKEGLAAFWKVANAIQEIRDYKGGKLWKSEGKSFRDYCEAQWHLEKSHVYRLAKSADFLALLKDSPNGEKIQLPVNECQLRPILALPAELRKQAWIDAVRDQTVDTLTGADIAAKVKHLRPAKAPKVPKDPQPPPEVEVIQETASDILVKLSTAVGDHPKHAEIVEYIKGIEELLIPAA